MIEVFFLLSFILVAAAFAVKERSILSSEVAFGVVGVALCVLFFVLRAPEVAIAQLIVELLVFVIMMRASGVKSDLSEPTLGSGNMAFVLISVVLAAVVAVFAVLSFRSLPEFGNPLMSVSEHYISFCRESEHCRNVVSAIIFRFRLFDAVAFSGVIFAAVIAVTSVLRGKGRAE